MLLIYKELSLEINDEYRLILHVAMQIGLYLHRQTYRRLACSL
jgi:hypothetical protein